MIFIIPCTEPEFEFVKQLEDTDCIEKETVEFVCEVNEPDAPVQWFREEKVSINGACVCVCVCVCEGALCTYVYAYAHFTMDIPPV